MVNKNRDSSIDTLRCVGLLAIFAAHTFSSEYILQLVCFDVTLLMMLGGASFAITQKIKPIDKWGEYFKKRFVRLVIPTWIFLIIYFCICYIFHKNVSIWLPIYAFTLLTNWYVWIIRVFLFIAFLSPLIIWFDRAVRNDITFVLLSLFFFILFDIFTACRTFDFSSFDDINNHIGSFLLFSILVCIPYLFIYAIGFRLSRIKTSTIVAYAMVLLILFGAMCYSYYESNNFFIRSDVYKYPPHLYYVSFTLGISLLLWCCRHQIDTLFGKISLLKCIVVFIGQNTIWIYLWHVLILSMTKNMESEIERFAVVHFSIIIYYIQYLILNKIVLPNIESQEKKKNIKRIFCG